MIIKYLYKPGDELLPQDLNATIGLLAQQQGYVGEALAGPWYILDGLQAYPTPNGGVTLTSGYVYVRGGALDSGVIAYVNGGAFTSQVYIYYKETSEELPDPQRGPSSYLGAAHCSIQAYLTDSLRDALRYNYRWAPFLRLDDRGRPEYTCRRLGQVALPPTPDHIICGLTLEQSGDTIEVTAGRAFVDCSVVVQPHPVILSYDPSRPYVNLTGTGITTDSQARGLNLGYVTPQGVWNSSNREVSLSTQHTLLVQHAVNQANLITLAGKTKQAYLEALGVYLECLSDNGNADIYNSLYGARFDSGKVYPGISPAKSSPTLSYTGAARQISVGLTILYLTVPYVVNNQPIPPVTGSITPAPSQSLGVEYASGLVYVHGGVAQGDLSLADSNNVPYTPDDLKTGYTFDGSLDVQGQASLRIKSPAAGLLSVSSGNTVVRLAPGTSYIYPTPSLRQQFKITSDVMWQGLQVTGSGSAYLYIYRGAEVIGWLFATSDTSSAITGSFRYPIYLSPGTYYLGVSPYLEGTVIGLTDGVNAQQASGADWVYLPNDLAWAPIVAIPTTSSSSAVITLGSSEAFDSLTVTPTGFLPCATSFSVVPRPILPGSYNTNLDVSLSAGVATLPLLDLQATAYSPGANPAISSWVRKELTLSTPCTSLEVGVDAMLVDKATLAVYISSNGGQSWENIPVESDSLLDNNSGLRRYMFISSLSAEVPINQTTIPRTRLQLRIDFQHADARSYFQRVSLNTDPGPISNAQAARLR